MNYPMKKYPPSQAFAKIHTANLIRLAVVLCAAVWQRRFPLPPKTSRPDRR